MSGRWSAFGIAVLLLCSVAACDGGSAEPAAPSPTPSASPSPRAGTLADYRAMVTGLAQAVRPVLDRTLAAKTLADVDATRIELAAILERKFNDLEAIEPPSEARELHFELWSLLSIWELLRDDINTLEDWSDPSDSCGIGYSSEEKMYEARKDIYEQVEFRLDDDLQKELGKLGLTLDGLLPPEPAEPRLQDRRGRNGAIVERNGSRGPGRLRITNGDSSDAAVSVVVGGDPSKPQATIYVRKNSTTTLTGVSGSYYSVYVKTGVDWDARRRRFTRGCSFEKFLRLFDGRSNWTIGLEKTADGNESTSGVPAY